MLTKHSSLVNRSAGEWDRKHVKGHLTDDDIMQADYSMFKEKDKVLAINEFYF